jgi:hypothetical protein
MGWLVRKAAVVLGVAIGIFAFAAAFIVYFVTNNRFGPGGRIAPHLIQRTKAQLRGVGPLAPH